MIVTEQEEMERGVRTEKGRNFPRCQLKKSFATFAAWHSVVILNPTPSISANTSKKITKAFPA